MVWATPKDAPCHDCIGTDRIGSAYCKNNCDYYPKLIKMRDSGELEWIGRKEVPVG